MLLAIAGVARLAWLLTRPGPAPHPLAIAPAEVAAVTIDGDAAGPEAAAVLAALPRKLAASRPVPAPAWLEPHVARLVLRSGVVLWVQAMPEGRDALFRVTADAPGRPTQSQAAQAARLRALRGHAYRLPAESIRAILGSTDLSTGTKAESAK